MFDGSSIAGWKAINESDMKLMPDPNTVAIDPFFAQTTLSIVCDVLEPLTDEPYSRDPRSIAKKAEAYLKQTKIGDTVYLRPRGRVLRLRRRASIRRRPTTPASSSTTSSCRPTPTPTTRWAISATASATKGGYFPVPPIDSLQDMRSEMLGAMASMGVKVEKHHHEVASAQHELGMKFGPLVTMADHLQIYKYCIHNVANAYGKTATFMPKPIYGDNGSGMHVHQSIWKGGKPLFAGKLYADLSEECLFYIGGIIKHAKALNAFTNPLTNSYKRLVPGYEAPVLLAYSSRNRSASCRIPVTNNPKAKRVEVRFPDPGANPYLAFAAMLMAGLDGIKNKIHPGEAMDKNLYDLPPKELKKIPTVCGSLREALAQPRQGPRLPQGRRRVHRRHDRLLHRAEDGGSHRASSTRRTRSSTRCTTRSDRSSSQGWDATGSGAASAAPFLFRLRRVSSVVCGRVACRKGFVPGLVDLIPAARRIPHRFGPGGADGRRYAAAGILLRPLAILVAVVALVVIRHRSPPVSPDNAVAGAAVPRRTAVFDGDHHA